MKTFDNVLSEDTLALVNSELLSNIKKSCWRVSNFVWDNPIRIGTVGNCLITDVSDELHDLIVRDITKHIPKFNYFNIIYHIWDKDSGVSLHDDTGHAAGITIYLSKEWDINYGGVFLYKPKNGKDGFYNAIVPKFNMMVYNDEFEMHMVTNISSLAPYPRISLQIWGEDEPYPENDI